MLPLGYHHGTISEIYMIYKALAEPQFLKPLASALLAGVLGKKVWFSAITCTNEIFLEMYQAKILI